MPIATANGIHIAYEEYGHADNPVMLLLQGLGMSSAAWPPPLIDALVDAGYRVITPDNRDVGQSDVLDHLGVPGFYAQALRYKLRLPVRAPYRLDDMMRDHLGLLDTLDIDAVDLVGVSMGGMIAQLLAMHAPQRVRSLTSVMSTTSRRSLPGATRPVAKHIMAGPAGLGTGERREFHRKLWRLLGSPAYPRTDEELEGFLDRIFARGMTAGGTARQTLAILAARSRVRGLRKLRMPVQVIHGEADPLVPIACGADTAAAIPGATMIPIAGMGHDLPHALLPSIADLLVAHAAGQA